MMTCPDSQYRGSGSREQGDLPVLPQRYTVIGADTAGDVEEASTRTRKMGFMSREGWHKTEFVGCDRLRPLSYRGALTLAVIASSRRVEVGASSKAIEIPKFDQLRLSFPSSSFEIRFTGNCKYSLALQNNPLANRPTCLAPAPSSAMQPSK